MCFLKMVFKIVFIRRKKKEEYVGVYSHSPAVKGILNPTPWVIAGSNIPVVPATVIGPINWFRKGQIFYWAKARKGASS